MSKFNKLEYQRDYMRKKRSGIKIGEEALRAQGERIKKTIDAVFDKIAKTPLCPDGYDKKMWAYACERAERAQRYAEKMPEHVRPSEVKFQDPEWQYQDQSRYPLPRVSAE